MVSKQHYIVRMGTTMNDILDAFDCVHERLKHLEEALIKTTECVVLLTNKVLEGENDARGISGVPPQDSL